MMASVLRSVLGMAVVLAVSGCGDGGDVHEDAICSDGVACPYDQGLAAPDRAPDLEGEVTQVTTVSAVSGDVDGAVLVVAEPGVEGTAMISFSVTPATALLREGGSGLEMLADLDDVVSGLRVRAWAVDGRVAESYPGQAEAEAIMVVGG